MMCVNQATATAAAAATVTTSPMIAPLADFSCAGRIGIGREAESAECGDIGGGGLLLL